MKIQELLEGMLRAQQALDAKLEVNEKKTEEKMSSLEAQMMAFMKRVSGKGGENCANNRENPIIANAGTKQKAHEDVDSSLWLERPTKNQWTLRPSLFNYRFSAALGMDPEMPQVLPYLPDSRSVTDEHRENASGREG